MTAYIDTFLKTEITQIPSLLDNYVGKYYNNTLCNGAFWMFFFWYLLHLIFDTCLNALFKRMRYKEYICIRLTSALWYLGFHSMALVYSVAIMHKSNMKFLNLEDLFSSKIPTSHFILGYIVLFTFYLHSACWERLQNPVLAAKYLCISAVLFISYISRFVEESLRLTVLISMTQLSLELTRCVTSLAGKQKLMAGFVTKGLFLGNILFFVNNVTILSVVIGYPVVNYYRHFNASVGIVLAFHLDWLLLEIYDSVLVKAFLHISKHGLKNGKTSCNSDLLDCSLFPLRTEDTYQLQVLLQEMKERQEKALSLRIPKNRNVVMQTLKCMVAIKRKLNEKRRQSNCTEEESNLFDEEEEENKVKNPEKNLNEVVGGKLQFNIQAKEQIECNNKTKKD